MLIIGNRRNLISKFYFLLMEWFSFYWSVRSLRCKVCAPSESAYHVDFIDNRRISYETRRPYCQRYDIFRCDRDQDACVTVVQPYKFSYLIAKGCTQSKRYPVMGCLRKKDTMQGVQFELGKRVAVNVLAQDTCVCDSDLCNYGTMAQFSQILAILLYFVVT
uniref:Protein quiver n=1 Tax=Romanomermis culicivorax TaxID=13658 RepID=A0A915HP00_ROMCU